MADPFIINQLQRQPLFARLSEAQLEQVADTAMIGRYGAGQYVFAQGQPTVGAQIFVAGRGALLSSTVQGGAASLGTVEAGQIINEAALFSEGVETASLRVLEPTVVLLIPRGPLRALMDRDAALLANLRVLDAEGARDTRKVLFRGQRANETVYRVYRRHWWGYLRYAWLPFLLAALFLVVSLVVEVQIPGIGLVVACVTAGLPIAALLFLLWEWRNDSIILTNQRLVSISMQAWRLTRSVNGIPLDRIGEVQIDIPGGDVFANLLGYGTLVVKTTSDRGAMSIRYVPDPASVQRTVFEYRDRFRQEDVQEEEDVVRAQVAEVLGIPTGGASTAAPNDADDVRLTTQPAGLPGLRTRFVNANGAVCHRHHWIMWLRMQMLPAILLIAAVVVAVLDLSGTTALPAGLGLSAGFFMLLIWAVWAYLRDWDWRNDLMIIEDNTITFQFKRPLWLQNQVEQVALVQLDNVSSIIGGVFGHLFNVGDISIQLVGGATEKWFRTVGDPEAVQAEVTWRSQRIKERSRETAEADRRQDIAQYLQAYHELASAQQGVPPAYPQAAQTTQFGAPAQTTQPVPFAAPTVPNAPYPTQPASPQGGGLPPNLTFRPGWDKPATPNNAPPDPTVPSAGSRPPKVPRPRPSDLPD